MGEGDQMTYDGQVRYVAKEEGPHSHSVTLRVYEVGAWHSDGRPDLECLDEVAHFYVKWDGCSHVGFRDPELNKEWVHVCGSKHMRRTLAMLAWAWNLCAAKLKDKGGWTEDLEPMALP